MRWGLVHTWKAFMTFTVTQSQNEKNSNGCGPSPAQSNGTVTKLDDLDLRVTINGTTKRWSVGSDSNGDYAHVLNPPETDLEKGGRIDDQKSNENFLDPKVKITRPLSLAQMTIYYQYGNGDANVQNPAPTVCSSRNDLNSSNLLSNRTTLTRIIRDSDKSRIGIQSTDLIPSLSWTDSEATSQCRPETVEYWKALFDMFDPEGFGEILWPEFVVALKSTQFAKAMEPGKLQILEDRAKVDSCYSSAITFQHFVNIMTGKRSRSFKCAVHQRDREVWSGSDYHLLPKDAFKGSKVKTMARLIADEFLTDERDRKYYADHYKCLPPPLFIISVTLIELGVFTYYSAWHGEVTSSGPLPIESPFVYRPDKRQEVWRFLFYMVLHAGWVHLMFNLLVQLLVGLPLEMVHGSLRIGCVYMAGVLAGSLGTSVFDPDVYLVGASGGVYALLAAHLANVLLNYNNMEFGLVRLLGVFLIASVDVGFAIYDRYAAIPLTDGATPPISYVAHLTGALAGLTIGLLVLKNFEQKLREQMLWWLALGVYGACTIFAVLFNLFHPNYISYNFTTESISRDDPRHLSQ